MVTKSHKNPLPSPATPSQSRRKATLQTICFASALGPPILHLFGLLRISKTNPIRLIFIASWCARDIINRMVKARILTHHRREGMKQWAIRSYDLAYQERHDNLAPLFRLQLLHILLGMVISIYLGKVGFYGESQSPDIVTILFLWPFALCNFYNLVSSPLVQLHIFKATPEGLYARPFWKKYHTPDIRMDVAAAFILHEEVDGPAAGLKRSPVEVRPLQFRRATLS